MAGHVRGIVHMLGGTKALGKRIQSNVDLDRIVREGLPWKAASHAKVVLSLKDGELLISVQ